MADEPTTAAAASEHNVQQQYINDDEDFQLLQHGQPKLAEFSIQPNCVGDKLAANAGKVADEAGNEVDEEEETSADPGWRRFKQWMHCFCVVTFDLEIGQTIEVVYPGNARLSQQERTDLCYLAFPDSNCSSGGFFNSPSSPPPTATFQNGDSGRFHHHHRDKEGSSTDSAHHFRLRRATAHGSLDKFSEAIAQHLPGPLRPDGRFLNGFAHFRRQRDPNIHRGYSQKSIVLLTHLPFVSLFSRVLTEVALAYFAAGETAIETACRQIGQYWPQPVPGGDRLLSLPLFGLRFCCSIPIDLNLNAEVGCTSEFIVTNHFEGIQMPKNGGGQSAQIEGENDEDEFEVIDYLNCNAIHLESVYEPDQHFHVGIKRVLHHLPLLWELVLLGEPIVVLAPSPALSSSLVHSLISLISPLKYNGDHRPYFTIHDSDFNEMCSKQNSYINGNCILGVTNPFFLKALAHWPHILKINWNRPVIRRERSESRLVKQIRSSQMAAQFVLSSLKRSGTASKGLDQFLGEDGQDEDEENQLQQKIIKRLTDRSQLENRSGGFFCSHRQFLQQDKTLPRKLLRTSSDSGSQWSTLRWHFAELTQSFMSPLESYISTLLPLRRELCPFQPVPQIRPFSLEQFLNSLRHFGHPGVKGDWQGLYRQFVTRSPNFIYWLRNRQKDIERQLRLEHMDVICNAQFSAQILFERNQVEIVDLVLKLTNRLAELDQKLQQHFSVSNSNNQRNNNGTSPFRLNLRNQRAKLQEQLNQIFTAIEDELKMVLLSNPVFRKAVETTPQNADGKH